MRQLVAIILITFCGVGTICSPTGNFSCMNYVPEVYARCLAKDDEITTVDFFFEHLLNFETLIEFIEHDVDDDDEDDMQDSPYQLPPSPAQTVVTVQQPLQLSFGMHYGVVVKRIYSLYHNPMKKGAYVNDVFRPPAA